MALKKGVYLAKKKNGTLYYRSSITYKNKHISLGSFESEEKAHCCYSEAAELLKSTLSVSDYHENKNPHLSFEKWVCLVNFRDNSIYFKNPIYLMKKYFIYYYDQFTEYKFDVDDLFFYSTHKIMKRGGHLFVADYGMQINILSRYGIKNYAVSGKDYIFINGDSTDLRYKNIQVINKYSGVSSIIKNGRPLYIAKIHINGDYIIGKYNTEAEAAIAYNKAGNLLTEAGVLKSSQFNYIEELSPIQYASIYSNVKISRKIRELARNN